VPQQDKACIRQSAASVEARRQGNNNFGQQQQGGGFGQSSLGQQKNITLYAADGNTKQCQTNEHGELTLEDTQWLNSHGGALPLNQVPQQDKCCIRQNASSVEARRYGNNNFNNQQ